MMLPRLCLSALVILLPLCSRAAEPFSVLQADAFAHHVERFNTMGPERVVNHVPDAQSWDWLRAHVPFFACPDAEVEELYYFRWWSMRKHLLRTPSGFAFTEFLERKDPISSAVGHHVMEGRWLREPRFIDDYASYWLHGGTGGTLHPAFHNYSEWLAHALYSRWLVNGDTASLTGRLDDLVRNYTQWDKEKLTSGGLYWQYDVRDAMEESISGARTKQNLRPPLNSYQFGNATAIAAIARLAHRDELAREFDAKAAALRRLVEERLWDDRAKFFKVRLEDGLPDAPRARRRDPAFTVPADKLYATLCDAREAIGFIPWYFSLPTPGRGYEAAWTQFADDAGFRAPFGLTTAERRHPKFRSHGVGGCEWDGAVWPYATSQTLTALANVLRDYPGVSVTARDWFDAFRTFARSQHDAEGRPYIGEYLDEKTGRWIDRGTRSRDYNHSTFADLVIAGVVGLRPRADDVVELSPLLPAGTWDWFCLDGVNYHGRTLTILWDRTGEKFQRGTGFTLIADGRTIAHSAQLGLLRGKL